MPAKFRPLNGSSSELARVCTIAHAAGATSSDTQSVVVRISVLPSAINQSIFIYPPQADLNDGRANLELPSGKLEHA